MSTSRRLLRLFARCRRTCRRIVGAAVYGALGLLSVSYGLLSLTAATVYAVAVAVVCLFVARE